VVKGAGRAAPKVAAKQSPKRGGKPVAPRAAANKTPRQKLDAIGIDAICTFIEDGLSLRAIAETLELADESSVRQWLAADVTRSARARASRSAAAAAYDDQALDGIQRADDPFSLAKAKEAAHHLRWRASKVNPREYGDKLDVTQTTTLREVSDSDLVSKLAKLGVTISALDTTGSVPVPDKPQGSDDL